MQFARRCWMLALVLGLSLLAWAGTPGSFRGTIVDNPQADKNWIYVQGRNGMARRVDISHARVIYDEDVPAAERRPKPEEELKPGTEVRVTAEQDSDGEWRASKVEILKAAVNTQPAASGSN
jgi:hypothetical protein